MLTQHLFPIVVGHDRFSIADQRANGRGIDGRALVDAGLDGEQESAGLGEFARPGADRRELGIHELCEVERLVRREPLDLREREPGLLERNDLVDPLQLAGP
jgi:hypothetical protein